MTSVCPDWDLPTIVEGMLRHGYVGLEPRVGWGHRAGLETDLSPAARAEARRRLEDAGLAVCCVASGARFAATAPAERRASLAETRRCIELAADLGCPLVRTFGGPRSEPWQLHHYVEHVVEGYREVLPEASAAGVTLLLETHDDWSASAPVRAVVERVGHERCAVLWDLLHPMRVMERPEVTFQNLSALTRHLHVHDYDYGPDGRSRAAALGEGLYDHEPPLRLLADAGFSGYASVEIIHGRGTEHDADGVLGQYAGKLREYLEAA
jgi:sugar phosphate isomerase/epimerase